MLLETGTWTSSRSSWWPMVAWCSFWYTQVASEQRVPCFDDDAQCTLQCFYLFFRNNVYFLNPRNLRELKKLVSNDPWYFLLYLHIEKGFILKKFVSILIKSFTIIWLIRNTAIRKYTYAINCYKLPIAVAQSKLHLLRHKLTRICCPALRDLFLSLVSLSQKE